MKIKRETIADERAFISWFLIECIASHGKQDPCFVNRLADQEEIDVQLIIDGEEVNFTETIEFFQSQVGKMVKEKAVELIQNRFADVSEILQQVEESVVSRMKEELHLDHY